MGKKERNYNPAEAQRKLDKKREKQKAKENVKQSQTARAATKELRAIEHEMTLFLTSNTDIKLAHSAAFQAKLGQINDARIKLNLSTKGVDDFQAQFKEIKKQRKDAKKQEQVASSRPKVDQLSNRAEFHAIESAASDKDESAEKDYDERDLSAITLPISGTALETEGQMYHGLTQLRVIKCSKVLLAKKEAARKQKQLLHQKQQQPHHHPYNHQSSLIPPPPPILGAFPFPGFMLPMGGMLPPPPPPYQVPTSHSLAQRHPSSFESRNSSRPMHNHQQQSPAGAGRFYSTSSHAKEPIQDPLAPEIDEPIVIERQQASQIVYGSAPKMRNIQKEVTGFVPSALLKKK